MTETPNTDNSMSKRPRLKTVTLIAGSLAIIFILAVVIVAFWTSAVTDRIGKNAANQHAHVLLDLVQACGESSSIESLQLFLRNIEHNAMLDDIRVIRTEITERDFDRRSDSVAPDAVEREVMRTGLERRIVDHGKHRIRFVSPNVAQDTCVRRCHESAKVGDVLGVASVTIDTRPTDTARMKLNIAMVMVFAGAGVVEVIFFIILLGREGAERERIRMRQANAQLTAYATRVEQLAVEAKEASKTKSEFLANMSHEIRTPMNAIIGFAELLRQEPLDSGQREYADIILDSSKGLLVLINDVLDFSKIEAGQLTVEISECSLSPMLSSVEAMMQGMAYQKGLSFRVRIADGIPALVRTDPHRIRQCLINLINNAIKFTDEGYVHVSVRCEGCGPRRLMVFDVEDTGIGIEPARQRDVFDAFKQVDGSATRKFGGTGLGLSITQQLAHLLGGEVRLVSEYGKGSIFTLAIPVEVLQDDDDAAQPDLDDRVESVEAATSLPAAPTETTRAPQGDKPIRTPGAARVLVAEDVRVNQMLIERLLTQTGVECVIVNNGAEAVEVVHNASESAFDLILMDMQMPVMNGYEATRRLRAAGVDTPIVALTANAGADAERKCIDVGCDDYLSKSTPVDAEQLREILARYVWSQKQTQPVGSEART